MPRAKDTKIWNEDLVTALRSREERCRQQFSQRQYVWRDGAAAIASIRKDIYQCKNGRIVGLPRTLTKTVEDECRAIIEGKRPLIPEGYLPTTLNEQKMSRGFVAPNKVNSYHEDPYLKRIKMRGGAYAILMAFHFSEAKTMTQKQICNAAQNFCDEEMEPNFYSGRSYGAWSSKKTLVKHGLVKESRTTQMGRHGQVCNGIFEYTLTDNGLLFIEALLVKFPLPSEPRCQFRSRSNNPDAMINTTQFQHPTKKSSAKHSKIELKDEYGSKENYLYIKNNTTNRQKTKTQTEADDWLLISDSDDEDHDDDDELINNPVNVNYSKQQKSQHAEDAREKLRSKLPDIIDLIDSSDDESVSDLVPPHQYKRNKTFVSQGRDLLTPREKIPTASKNTRMMKKSTYSDSKLVIVIDDRERNKNATPRQMRIELSRHLSQTSGSLKQIWPLHLPIGEVEEEQLNYGDFAFRLKQENLDAIRRLPVTIERKRISDLVQRSSRAHHWQQLHRMRDCCDHAILLIEGNTKKTSNFSSYDNVEGESWNPDHHSIDDERALYRFLGRAILSSPVLKILQTPHEQASYRSIGATGLVASLLLWGNDAPKLVQTTKVSMNKLYNKLKSRGIPWQISRRISEELGSIQQLDNIFNQCEPSCRASVLVPTIKESCSGIIETENSRSLLEYGTVESWSLAICSAWYSRLDDPSQVVTPYEENKYFANDRAQLLTALHRGKTVQCAVKESNIVDEKNLRDMRSYQRRVRIKCSSKFSTIFPSDDETETFYETESTEENPLGLILPSVVMETNNSAFQSNKLIVCVIEGSDLFQRVRDGTRSQSVEDLIEVSKAVAEQVSLECSSFLMNEKHDRKVLLIRGLGAAIAAAAKQANYRAECRVLVDVVIADLMIRHDIVVVQAHCLVNDLEMILQEFAMACFYYQLTTRKLLR